MGSPWDRITDDAYKKWLLQAMEEGEYNQLGPVERRTLLTQFQQQQQPQQQRKFRVVVSLSHCIDVACFLFSSDTHVPHPFIMLTPAPTSISTN